MGPPKEGKLFWDRWLREYYQDRIPVAVDVERVSVWSDDRTAPSCADVHRRAARPATRPPQAEPKNGTGPRVDSERAAAAPALASTTCCSHTSAPTDTRRSSRSQIEDAGPDGIRLTSERPLPPGGRRAGMLGALVPARS